MKKIIINDANFNSEAYDATTVIDDMKYFVFHYDNLSEYYDGQTLNNVDIVAFKYSVDVESYLQNYCYDYELNDASGELHVYEVWQPEEVGFTEQKEAYYRCYYEEGSFAKKYYSNVDEYVKTMKEKDLKEAENFIICEIDDNTFYLEPREVSYGMRVTAEIQ